MCTLTYIPLGDKEFIFTTNRDEDPKRIAIPPNLYINNNVECLYPKDQLSEGTWMLCNKEYSLCLLNGAFVKHKHSPPYRKSRGLVVLEFSNYKSVTEFVLNYNFEGIEPFTMLVLTYGSKFAIEEIRWDGGSIHYKNLDPLKTEIWSSSTLYDESAKEMRREWFAGWKSEGDNSTAHVLKFHKNAGNGDAFNGLIMNRKEMVKTTSITQISCIKAKISMRYEDLRNGEVTEKYLEKEKSLS